MDVREPATPAAASARAERVADDAELRSPPICVLMTSQKTPQGLASKASYVALANSEPEDAGCGVSCPSGHSPSPSVLPFAIP
mmetsp:Transcript_14465/g.29202  ORF Transcript_14465/g.29202 Transcript_14465/m.29202 type:complete len:83 (+) Transcript_14465:3127-3375(+)